MSCDKLPKLVVFDLDFTIWNKQVDKCSTPFLKHPSGSIKDSEENSIQLYPEIKNCLGLLQSAKIPMGVASRISDVAGAYQLLYLLNIRQYFQFIEVYPTGKRLHFQRIKKKSGVQFDEMVFFDDDERNIKDIGKLGVNCILVKNGLTSKDVKNLLSMIT